MLSALCPFTKSGSIVDLRRPRSDCTVAMLLRLVNYCYYYYYYYYYY